MGLVYSYAMEVIPKPIPTIPLTTLLFAFPHPAAVFQQTQLVTHKEWHHTPTYAMM